MTRGRGHRPALASCLAPTQTVTGRDVTETTLRPGNLQVCEDPYEGVSGPTGPDPRSGRLTARRSGFKPAGAGAPAAARRLAAQDTLVLKKIYQMPSSDRLMLLAPFPFKDKRMEQRYQLNFHARCLDRTRLVTFSIAPIIGTMRCIWLVYWSYNFENLPRLEMFLGSVRVMEFFAIMTIYLNKWSGLSAVRLSIGMLWMFRTLAILVFVHQLLGNHSDPQLMSELVLVACVLGLYLPNFTEYVCYSLPMAYVRPFFGHMVVATGQGHQDVYQIAFQHTLILALGFTITWTIHSDSRRDWLRSANAPMPESRSREKRARSERGEPHVGGCPADEWDTLDDGYFAPADRALLRAAAMQARAPRNAAQARGAPGGMRLAAGV